MKPVGEPDAVAPHVRFDERGWETKPHPPPRAHPRLYGGELGEAHGLSSRVYANWGLGLSGGDKAADLGHG